MNHTYARSRFKHPLMHTIENHKGKRERARADAPVPKDWRVISSTATRESLERVMHVHTSLQAIKQPKGSHPGRRYRHVPRIYRHTIGDIKVTSIDITREARREVRNARNRYNPNELPVERTQAMLRMSTVGGFARGLALSIGRYGSALVFSKAMRIKAGKR